MRHNSGLVEIDERAYPVDEKYEGYWEVVHAVGYERGKAKGKGNNTGTDSRGRVMGPGKNLESENLARGSGQLPYKWCNWGGRSARPRSVAKTKQRGGARKGVFAVEEGDAENTSAGAAEDFGDLDLCAVEEVWGVGAGQAGASTPDDLPPGLIDLDEFNP